MSFDAPTPAHAPELPAVMPQNETTVLRDAHATADAIERIRAAGAIDLRTIVEGGARTGELVAIVFTAPALGTSYYMPLLGSEAAEDAQAAASAAVRADPGV